MPNVTRTVGPLRFEDLDPKRFGDLVRQLVYEFKTWRQLEAAGRAGNDDGFEARGLEIVPTGEEPEIATPAEPGDADEHSRGTSDRLWIIQCKRERTIGSAKLIEYLGKLNLQPEDSPYGLIFAAACDFSKTARDMFREHCRLKGIRAAHLWGKRELEDLLMLPQNDHLLFAYFGFSLIIRQRTRRTELRTQIAAKKQIQSLVERDPTQLLLIRNAFGDLYPKVPQGPVYSDEHWRLCPFDTLSHRGLVVEWASFMAFIDDGPAWDAADANGFRQSHLHAGRKWNRGKYESSEYDRARKFWNGLEEKNRAWVRTLAVIPYDRILAIDDVGDDYFSGTHIFCRYERGTPIAYSRVALQPIKANGLAPMRLDGLEDSRRVEKFPQEFRLISMKSAD